MKMLLISAVVLLAGCDQSPKVVQWSPPKEPERESIIEFVQEMPSAEVEKEKEPYRTWLIAQRSGVCELHRIKMQRRWIPVVYGLPATDSLPTLEEGARFPHGSETSLGGCMATATKEHEVFLCPECAKAYRAWQKKEPLQRNAPMGPLRTSSLQLGVAE